MRYDAENHTEKKRVTLKIEEAKDIMINTENFSERLYTCKDLTFLSNR